MMYRTLPMSGRKGEIRLTSTSYVVLGMLDWLGPSTPYRLKRVLASRCRTSSRCPHTSFYAEPARLAAAGYLAERIERGRPAAAHVRRSRRAGATALRAWLAGAGDALRRVPLPGDAEDLLRRRPRRASPATRRDHHAALAASFEGVRAAAERGEVELTGGPPAVLETGIELHRWWEARWRELGAVVASIMSRAMRARLTGAVAALALAVLAALATPVDGPGSVADADGVAHARRRRPTPTPSPTPTPEEQARAERDERDRKAKTVRAHLPRLRARRAHRRLRPHGARAQAGAALDRGLLRGGVPRLPRRADRGDRAPRVRQVRGAGAAARGPQQRPDADADAPRRPRRRRRHRRPAPGARAGSRAAVAARRTRARCRTSARAAAADGRAGRDRRQRSTRCPRRRARTRSRRARRRRRRRPRRRPCRRRS